MKLKFCNNRQLTNNDAQKLNSEGNHNSNSGSKPFVPRTFVPVSIKERQEKRSCFGCHTQSTSHEYNSSQAKFASHALDGDVHTRLLFLLPILFWMFISSIPTKSFGQKAFDKMFRAYMDNDFFAYQKEDGAYTNGLRFDYYYQQKGNNSLHRPLYFNAGKNSTTTSSIGIMQIMITPNDIRDKHPAKDDYPYSGSLFINRTFNSINRKEKKSIKTEYVLGIVGPKSLAGETQSFVHRILSFARPVGWNTQYHTSIFANVNISAEQLLFSPFQGFEIIGGGEVDMGTLLNSASIQSTIRFGKMSPYFNGYINQYTSSGKGFILYMFIKPQAQFVAHDTLLEGTTLNYQTDIENPNEVDHTLGRPKPLINHELFITNIGLVAAYRGFGLSATYTEGTGLLEHQPSKAYGNISIYVGL